MPIKSSAPCRTAAPSAASCEGEDKGALKTATITRLGHRGDGVSEDGLYVPFALPGEEVRVAPQGGRARLVEILKPSADRVAPICPHFGRCGGCALQHMGADAYRAWKRDLVVTALRQRGLDATVDPLIPCPPRSRRRAVLAARWSGGRIVLGFHERLSHQIVPVETCPVLEPRIERALPGIARLLAGLGPAKGEAALTVLATDAGLDLSVAGLGPPSDPAARAELVGQARALGFARLSLSGETIAVFAEPRLRCGSALIVPPPGGFVQAVAEAEAEMARLVMEGVGKAARIADLFAGMGTFALRLAAGAPVHAVEGDRAAAQALATAARTTPGLKPVTVEVRDLVRRPLAPQDLARFDAVVLDPPRAGAEAQASRLAASRVARIVAVSCNPATFARDARILVDGGYRLARIVPIDQFAFSPHVEVVASFLR